ncbi:MAG: ribulokinase [Spirochaetota bacterium]|nr:MAG: ribulokinase [Spirochaetota bacterium]
MPVEKYVIGVDFGTDSVRTVIVNTDNGDEVGSYVASFPRWSKGMFCDPSRNQFRQHPLDYTESLEISIKKSLEGLKKDVSDNIVGIGIDTTGSTPAPVDKYGTVLALKDEFRDNPNAMFILWKDHTAVDEAEEINNVSKTWGGPDFTKYEGGVYSSEWFWSKILHVLRSDPEVEKHAFSWVEHADWVPALLTGNLDPLTLKRSRCAAGHKAMWHNEWNGLPSNDFLATVDPLLTGLTERLYKETHTSNILAGRLTKEWSGRLGLQEGIAVSVGSFDAHSGAVGVQIDEHTFVMILGTSGCDMVVTPPEVLGNKLVSGICGQVDGSMIPGMIGLEAGQSSFGDVYAWFRDILLWPFERLPSAKKKELPEIIMAMLSKEAERIKDDETFPIAMDWLNGRRTPYADQRLKGALVGLTLGTTAPKLFKALVESTAFGARAILDRFEEEGLKFDTVVASGGIPKKSPYVMQVLSNVLGIPVKIALSDQAGALGSAMFAACAAGQYDSVQQAQRNMGTGFIHTYNPQTERVKTYSELYQRYKRIGGLLEEEFRN